MVGEYMLNRFCLSLVTLLVLAFAGSLAAQETPQAQEPPRGEMGQRVLGTVASVGVDRFTVKKADGAVLTVLVNDQTRYREQQREFHLEDLKPGDHVALRGNASADKQFVAEGVMRVTEEQYQRFLSGGGRGPGGPSGMGPGAGPRAGGEIISIDKDRITVRNPRQGERVIVVNDQTTFSKEGQTIALKDLKVGDRIFALGKEQDGQFVATQVRSGRPGGMMHQRQGPPPDDSQGPPPQQ